MKPLASLRLAPREEPDAHSLLCRGCGHILIQDYWTLMDGPAVPVLSGVTIRCEVCDTQTVAGCRTPEARR